MNEKGYSINGKKQAIDILQSLTPGEKETILKNISLRNSSIAKELSEKSFNYQDLTRLEDQDIQKVFNLSNPSIIGLALHNSSDAFKRKVLNLIDRNKAEAAFKVMSRDLTSHHNECVRAQTKVLNQAIELSRRSIIKLS